MPETFDPYHRWLGIGPEEQPANHYRLLGIRLYESSAEVIEHAADRQMAHLRTFQAGKHGSLSQKLLNEVAAAKICLLNPKKKAVYDERLQEELKTRGAGEASGADEGLDSDLVEALQKAEPRKVAAPNAARRKPPQNLAILIGAAALGVLLVLGLIVWLAIPGRKTVSVAARAEKSNDARPAVNQPKPSPEPTKPAAQPESQQKAPEPSQPPVVTTHVQPAKEVAKPPAEPPKANVPEPKPVAKPATSPNRQSAATTPATLQLTPKPESPPAPAPPNQRLPLPAEAEQEKALRLARDVLHDKAKTPAEKADLAKKLLQQIGDNRDEPAMQFVLLRQAYNLAMEAADVVLVADTIDKTAGAFDVDGLGMKLKMLAELAKPTRSSAKRVPPPHKAIAEQALAVVEEAMAANEFARARALGELARSEAGKARAKEVGQQAREALADLTQVGKGSARYGWTRLSLGQLLGS